MNLLLLVLMVLVNPSPAENAPVICPTPGGLMHGQVEVTGLEVGSTATFTCHPSYQYNGFNPRVCQEDGTWSGVKGQCRGTCEPSVPQHGKLTLSSKPGEKPKFKLRCNEGYTRTGSEELVCLTNNTLIGKLGTCVEKSRVFCPKPKLGSHVIIDYETYATDLVISLSCEEGYIFTGRQNVTCQGDGEWTDIFASCKAIRCPHLPDINKGTIKTLGKLYKDVALVKCEKGYKVQGPSMPQCLPTGKWSPIGQCKAIQCPPLSYIEHGSVKTHGNMYDDIGHITCDEGYEVYGASIVRCLPTGKWSNLGYCTAMSCKGTPEVRYGQVTRVTTSFNDYFAIECNPGYTLQGHQEIVCQDGTWSKPGQCVDENPHMTGAISGVVAVIVISVLILAAFIILRRRRDSAAKGMLNVLNDVNRTTVEEILIDAKRVTIKEKIGQGHFGLVYNGTLRKRTNRGEEEPVALKTMKDGPTNDSEELNHFIQEATIMRGFDHPNVLALLGITVIENQVYVILPVMEVGGLKNYIQTQPFDRDLHIRFLLDAAKGLEYLSGRNFVHRDVAARNCMLDSKMNLFISDFGLARDLHSKDYYSPADKTKKIPIRWMAPESLDNFTYTTKSDVWSYGVLMWEVFSKGAHPYAHVNPGDILDYLENGNRLRKPRRCPMALYNLQMVCWALKPSRRPTFSMLVSGLEDIYNNLGDLESISSSSSGSSGTAGP